MDTIFTNSENSKTSKPHILKLKLADKLDLRIGERVTALSNLSIYYTWKNMEENRTTFQIRNRYSLELLTKVAIKLLGSTENKITKYKNGENAPHLETTEVVLVHCNMVNNDYQQDSRVLYTFVPNKSFGSLLDISPSNHIFSKTFNSEYEEIIVWFTDQNSKPLEIEDRINLTMIVE